MARSTCQPLSEALHMVQGIGLFGKRWTEMKRDNKITLSTGWGSYNCAGWQKAAGRANKIGRR